jgi:YVTN family beta-propeller protein
MTAGGVVEVVDTTRLAVTATISVASNGDIAITPDGARAYVAAGLVYVIDTATNMVEHSFPAEAAPRPEPEIAPDIAAPLEATPIIVQH